MEGEAFSQFCLGGIVLFCLLTVSIPVLAFLSDAFGHHPRSTPSTDCREQAEAAEDALDQLFDEDGLH